MDYKSPMCGSHIESIWANPGRVTIEIENKSTWGPFYSQQPYEGELLIHAIVEILIFYNSESVRK